MSRTAQLFELQQIDSALDSRVARMRQIDELMADSPELVAARAALEEASTRLAGEQTRLKKLSREAEETSARLKMLEKRLFDGSIKNPKELGKAQEEVEHLKGRLRDQEDGVIEAMLAAEEAEEARNALQGELDTVSKEWQQFLAGLTEEKDTLLAHAKVLQVKRQRAMKEVAWEDLQLYERLRRGKGGLAVAAVKGGLCGGCHVAVTATILRLARTSPDFVKCPTCERILYPMGEIKFQEFDHDLDNIAR
ncbi:MAG: hypothetical protein M3328_12275 [Chloroflexota bacterium]|nr:hypothetical protein [Chloroflexota bacterium]